jgi:hypothetical protein
MTTAQLIALIVSIVVVSIPIAGLLVSVLNWVRKDSKETGKLGEQVLAFTTRVTKFESDRADLIKHNEARIAEALRINNEIIDRQNRDLIEAVQGFRVVVDDLKSEFSAIKNMWAGERKLIEQLRSLELEIARLIEKFRALEHDLLRLQLDHEKNHPREQSGKILLHREDGTPHLLGDEEEGNK